MHLYRDTKSIDRNIDAESYRQQYGRRQAQTRIQLKTQKRDSVAPTDAIQCTPGRGLGSVKKRFDLRPPVTAAACWGGGALNQDTCLSFSSLVIAAPPPPHYTFSLLSWQRHAQTHSATTFCRSGEWRKMTLRTWWYCRRCFRTRSIRRPTVQAQSSISRGIFHNCFGYYRLQMLLSDHVIRPIYIRWNVK